MQARITAHVAARAVCLIALPAAIYLAAFALHFAVLTQCGPGDGSMPSLFQAGLNGTKLVNQPRGPCGAHPAGEHAVGVKGCERSLMPCGCVEQRSCLGRW